MGQYWIPVNLDKKQFIDPHKLGSGLKLWEQLANHGVGQALVILLAAMPERRGGGDLGDHKIVGSWAGDRVTFVGDYAEDGDLVEVNPDFQAKRGDRKLSLVYGLCRGRDEEGEGIPFTDVTDEVCAVIEAELEGVFCGDGWRNFHDLNTPEAKRELSDRKAKSKPQRDGSTATLEAEGDLVTATVTFSCTEGTSDKLYRMTLIQHPDNTHSVRAESCRAGYAWKDQGFKADHVHVSIATDAMRKIKREKEKKGYRQI
jgi:hypothetical protein